MDSENSTFTMPVAPAYGNGGFGMGGDWSWILLLVLLCGGGFGGGGYDFPWLLNGQNMINANTNAGFDHAATQSALGDLRTTVGSGFGDIQTALCGGFAGTTAAVTGAQSAITQQMYANQIADMQQQFALQSQLSNCCCENRAATQDLKYTLATEACASRQTSTDNTQKILDKLCALELDGYKREADNLRTQLNMANLAASQTAQTATLRAGQIAAVDSLYDRLSACPIPSWSVPNPMGCGCGA